VSAETGQPLQVEATGETVGEAKWSALRELERLAPGLDKTAVRFQIVSEGERGLLGVGYAPARVVAVVDEAPEAEPAAPDTPHAAQARELVERVAGALGVECRVQVAEDEDAVHVRCSGGELGVLIGRHGQTIDAIQYLANAIAYRSFPDDRKEVVVDAAGYRERRRATLEALAVRSAERALRSGEPVELEPMSAVERKVVHLRLKSFSGVETTSEGAEPNRFVVIVPLDA
jgi:spoIIIJ-associated protein